MKKVLFLNSLYYPNFGGIENSIKELSSIFIEKGYSVDLICSNRNYTNDHEVKLIENIDGINIYRYQYPSGFLGFIQQFYYIFKILLTYRKEYELIISRNYLLTVLATLVYGFRVIYIIPAIMLYQNKKSLKKFLDCFIQFFALVFSKKNYVFSNSVKIQVEKQLLGLKKTELINVGINRKKFENKISNYEKILKELDLPKNKNILLCLGRFSEVKGFHIAIESMRYLSEDCILLIVGDGPEIETYKDIIKKYDLSKKVKIYNSTMEPEKFYAVSNIFLMTSRYEAFGQVLLEATAARNRIVAFDCLECKTAVKEIFNQVSFVEYCKYYDSEHLSKTIVSCMNKEVNENDFDKILSNYSWEKMVDNLIRTN